MNNNPKTTGGFRKRRWPWVIAAFLALIGLWHLLTSLYPEQEKALRRQFRQTVTDTFPRKAVDFSKTFGLVRFEAGGEAPQNALGRNRAVVLVHGLDDPGKVWMTLAPG